MRKFCDNPKCVCHRDNPDMLRSMSVSYDRAAVRGGIAVYEPNENLKMYKQREYRVDGKILYFCDYCFSAIEVAEFIALNGLNEI